MSFLDDFRKVLNYRISYRIQNVFFDAFDSAIRDAKRQELNHTLSKNADELLDQTYNNEFSKYRYKKNKEN
jgi:hypothetical protein